MSWFLFDLGNTIIKLAYERVIENICRDASVNRDELLEVFEQAGGYRDMERGAVTFHGFYDFLCDKAGYRGSSRQFYDLWTDFFDGVIPGMEELVERVRARHQVAFLSNSNEVHAEVIPRKFPTIFLRDDRFIFSHRYRVAKPDPEIFQRAMELLATTPEQTVFVDDLLENVLAARSIGIKAIQFRDAATLTKELKADGFL
jgi:HAD superfamily hydrolase (TIGR01509 family)